MRKTKNHKSIIVFTVLVVILLIMLGFSGCGSVSSRNIEKYGTDITIKEITNVRDILVNSSEYLDQTIRLEGKITRECPSGCWFFVEDNTGTIFVDINPSGFSIPPKVGAKIIVEGTVSNINGRIGIIGKGVEF